jgi:hypothetical protein
MCSKTYAGAKLRAGLRVGSRGGKCGGIGQLRIQGKRLVGRKLIGAGRAILWRGLEGGPLLRAVIDPASTHSSSSCLAT